MSVSPYLLLYISERSRPKLGEWQATLRRYNVAVRGVPYPAPRTDASVRADAEARLRGAAESPILGVLWESSALVLPGTTTPAPRAHLQAVEHLSRALLFSLRDGALAEDGYEGRAPGYLDLRDGPAEGWWDARFRMDETGATPAEWRERTGAKVSARDVTAARLIADRLRGPPRDFRFFGVVPGRPVDFARLALDDLDGHPFFGLPEVATAGLAGLFHAVANAGVHYRAPADKRGSVLWQPGLHGGIPTTPKPDPMHEATYLAHDLFHHLLPDPLFEGTVSEATRRVYVVARMLSEAFTLVLADMVFVDAVRASGYAYDYGRRLAWPVYAAAGLAGAPVAAARLREVLLANGHFCVRGSLDPWRRVAAGPGADAALTAFGDGYAKFFRADLVWTAANFRDMARRADEHRRLHALIAPVVEARGLGLETVPALARAAGVDGASSLDALVDGLGAYLFDTRIAPLLRAPPPLDPIPTRRGRAFARWMCGQLMLHVRYDSVPEVRAEGRLLADALARSPAEDADEVARLRAFFERRVDRLAARGMLAPADAVMFREMVPHVEPRFVGFRSVLETHPEAARRLLGGRADDRAPGVVLLIRDVERGRCLVQRKDERHPTPAARGRLSLWGGSIEPGEEPEDALPRELAEELRDPLLIAELLDLLRYRRRFRLAAAPWPGEYDLYVFEAAASAETFERWVRDLAAPGAVLEGEPAVVEAAEMAALLATPDAFLASQDEVVRALVPGFEGGPTPG
jgi:ADP-ribose pyrophosphatase YjhB (NUDIX family)